MIIRIMHTQQVDDMMLVADEHTENSRHLLATADTKPPKANGNFLIWFDSLKINQVDANNSISIDTVVIDKNECSKFNTSTVPHSAKFVFIYLSYQFFNYL